MVEKQSATTNRDTHLAISLRHKWQAEIERAVNKVKVGVVPNRIWKKKRLTLWSSWTAKAAKKERECKWTDENF